MHSYSLFYIWIYAADIRNNSYIIWVRLGQFPPLLKLTQWSATVVSKGWLMEAINIMPKKITKLLDSFLLKI